MLQFLRNLFRSRQKTLSCFGRTDTGMVRKNNEDNFAILVEKKLFIVADGMGGHKAGEVASRVATESLVAFFSPEKLKGIRGNPMAIQHALIHSFSQTNDKVMEMAAENPDLQGMGCTLIACLVDSNVAYLAHVGDVRGYLADGYQLNQVTTDHSIVADQTTMGIAGSGQSIGRNVITRGIGFPFAEDAEFHRLPLHPGNKLLLCSDGLWGMVGDEEMFDIIHSASSPEVACDTLVDRANEAGGKDNITALVVFC